MEVVDSLNNKLPHDHLLILFSYLPIKDLVSVQCVSHGWRIVAQDSFLWKDFTYEVQSYSYGINDERALRTMPALRNITGCKENEFLNVILECVIQLSRLNVCFYPPITSSQIQTTLEKYHELESISLQMCSPDILESLEILKSCENLKEVIFYTSISHSSYSCCSLTKLWNMFNIFTDSESAFLALRTIDLTEPRFVTALKHKKFRDLIVDIITDRSQNLQSVKLEISYPCDCDVLNAVSQCKKLKELDITLKDNCPTDIFIDRMAGLKSLSLRFLDLQNSDNLSSLPNILRCSWTYLTKVSFSVGDTTDFRGGILKVIAENVKQLKDLHYVDEGYHTDEDEMYMTGDLPNLLNLHVEGLNSISEVGVDHVLSCNRLTSLSLHANNSHIENLQGFIKYTLCQLKELEEIAFSVSEKINVNLWNKEEIKIFIS